jgi:hypothetical protein
MLSCAAGNSKPSTASLIPPFPSRIYVSRIDKAKRVYAECTGNAGGVVLKRRDTGLEVLDTIDPVQTRPARPITRSSPFFSASPKGLIFSCTESKSALLDRHTFK